MLWRTKSRLSPGFWRSLSHCSIQDKGESCEIRLLCNILWLAEWCGVFIVIALNQQTFILTSPVPFAGKCPPEFLGLEILFSNGDVAFEAAGNS